MWLPEDIRRILRISLINSSSPVNPHDSCNFRQQAKSQARGNQFLDCWSKSLEDEGAIDRGYKLTGNITTSFASRTAHQKQSQLCLRSCTRKQLSRRKSART